MAMIRPRKMTYAELEEARARASKEAHLLYQVLRDFIEMRPYTFTKPIKTPAGEVRASIHNPLSPTGGYVMVIDKTFEPEGVREHMGQVAYLEDWISTTNLMLRGMQFSDPDREPLQELWLAVKQVQGMAIDKDKRDRELGKAGR